jgi:hypothetical protein
MWKLLTQNWMYDDDEISDANISELMNCFNFDYQEQTLLPESSQINELKLQEIIL